MSSSMNMERAEILASEMSSIFRLNWLLAMRNSDGRDYAVDNKTVRGASYPLSRQEDE